MTRRSTEAETEQRIGEIYALLLRSVPRERILEFTRKSWGVSRATTDAYIARAKGRIRERIKAEQDEYLALAIAQRNDLYRQSYKQGKYWHCLEIAKDRDKLLMLYTSIDDAIAFVERAGYIVSLPPELEPTE